MTATDQAESVTTGISPGRAVGVGLAALVGYVIGFYAGIIVLLMGTDFNELGGAPFELATVPAGMVLAGIAGALASPMRRESIAPALAVAVGAALPTVLGLMALDGDYGHAIAIGGLLAVVVTIGAVVTVHEGLTRS